MFTREIILPKLHENVKIIYCQISGNVYWRIKGMRDDKSETPRCLSNCNGSFNVFYVHWSNKSHGDYSVFTAISSYHVPSM